MSIRAVAIVASAVAAISGVQAQEPGAGSRLAEVDATGRVVPVPPASALAERIDGVAKAPACTIGQPLAAEAAQALVRKIATEENFYPDLVMAVARAESQFNSDALSEKGAFGLMQLMAGTADRFKVDRCDPAANVRGGVRFLRALQVKYQNPFFVLAAYNAGEEAVRKSRGVPPFPETVRYVAQVINEIYALPAPGEAPRRAPMLAGNASDLLEPAAPASAPPTSTKSKPVSRWDDGFVMHFD